MFERFTVDLNLGTYVDSDNSNTCQMTYLMFHEAYQRRQNNEKFQFDMTVHK